MLGKRRGPGGHVGQHAPNAAEERVNFARGGLELNVVVIGSSGGVVRGCQIKVRLTRRGVVATYDVSNMSEGVEEGRYLLSSKATMRLTPTQGAPREVLVFPFPAKDPSHLFFEGQMLEIMDKALAEVNLSGLDAFRRAEIDTALAVGRSRGDNVAQTVIEALQAVQQQAGVRVGGRVVVPFGGGVSAGDINKLASAIEAITRLEQQRLQAEQNPPPVPVRVNVQPPAARPKEAPLPAVTSP